MKCEFSRVIDGITKFIDNEMYSRMNSLQEVAARVVIGRIITNQELIKQTLMDNSFIRSFGIIDSDGMVDAEGLARDIKREIEKKGKITFSIPLFGNFTFVPSDMDNLYRHIVGGVHHENN